MAIKMETSIKLDNIEFNDLDYLNSYLKGKNIKNYIDCVLIIRWLGKKIVEHFCYIEKDGDDYLIKIKD